VKFDGEQPHDAVRNIAEVTIAVANGDLSRKITVDVRERFLQLKETINTMVDSCARSPRGHTRGARSRHRGPARRVRRWSPGRRHVEGLTDSVNAMGTNLTAQVRNIAEVTTAVARAICRARSRST